MSEMLAGVYPRCSSKDHGAKICAAACCGCWWISDGASRCKLAGASPELVCYSGASGMLSANNKDSGPEQTTGIFVPTHLSAPAALTEGHALGKVTI